MIGHKMLSQVAGVMLLGLAVGAKADCSDTCNQAQV